MILTFRPIKVWPEGWQDPNRRRDYTPFDSSYSATLQLLDRELTHLGTRDATLQVDARETQVRLDGQLKADAKVEHPGAIVTIETAKLGTLVYSCDRYIARWSGKVSWQENLRAIALGLEALRKVERYGIANRGEQYAGYRELGSGIPLGQEPPSTMTADEAARFMSTLANMPAPVDDVIGDPDLADLMYKYAAKTCHPDVGGEAETFKQLGEARRVVARAYAARAYAA
ncbi:MAG: hypothetical protein H0W70_10265 [Actinobacteria bacterium]|nr:hypothetical protein [Actinomycetota bacterium]